MSDIKLVHVQALLTVGFQLGLMVCISINKSNVNANKEDILLVAHRWIMSTPSDGVAHVILCYFLLLVILVFKHTLPATLLGITRIVFHKLFEGLRQSDT